MRTPLAGYPHRSASIFLRNVCHYLHPEVYPFRPARHQVERRQGPEPQQACDGPEGDDEHAQGHHTTAGQEIMELLQKINRERGMTIIVVTHDPKVARMTRRILTLEDGRIVDDHPMQTPVIEDLRELARSQLGELLLERRGERLKELGLGSDEGLTTEGEYLRGLLVGLT